MLNFLFFFKFSWNTDPFFQVQNTGFYLSFCGHSMGRNLGIWWGILGIPWGILGIWWGLTWAFDGAFWAWVSVTWNEYCFTNKIIKNHNEMDIRKLVLIMVNLCPHALKKKHNIKIYGKIKKWDETMFKNYGKKKVVIFLRISYKYLKAWKFP